MSWTISFSDKLRSMRSVVTGFVALYAICLTGQLASARQVFVLTSNNSTLDVVNPASNPLSRAAVTSWVVDGVDQLQELSNYYRIGSAGPETSVHTLTLQFAAQTGPNTASVAYAHPQFLLGLDYTVLGGPPGSGVSSMGETVRITNTSATAPLDFHFFEYLDLDLTNTPSDDFGTPVNAGRNEQRDGQTIVTAGFLNADHHEFAFFPTTLNHLLNGSTSILNDQPPFGANFGIGDVTWALQWDFAGTNPPRTAIPPGQTVIITKNLMCMPVPEPTGSIAAVMVFVALVNARRRR